MEVKSDIKKGKLYSIAFNSSLGSVSWGYQLTIFNALRHFLVANVFPDASDTAIATIASILTVGAAAGAYYTGRMVSTYGRLKTLLFADFLGIIGPFLCMFHSLPIVFLGRTIAGFSIGINSAVVSLYNVEMSPLVLKGKMSTISMLMLATGLLIGFVAESFVPDLVLGKDSQIWRVLFGFAMVFHFVRGYVLLRILPFETPFFLVLKDKYEEAKEVLGQIYSDNIESHLQKVIKDKEAIKATGNPTISDLFTPKYRNATIVALLLTAGVQVVGFSPVFVFCNMFIEKSAGGDIHAMARFSDLLGIVSFFATALTTVFVERFGRRPLILIGTAGLFVCEILFVLVSVISGSDDWSLKYILTVFWPIFYRLTSGSLAFVYAAEVLPSVGVSFALFTNWVWAFITIQTFIPLVKIIGLEGVMFIWSLFCLFSTIYYKNHLIESKGKTKAELLSLYDGTAKGQPVQEDVEMHKIPLLKAQPEHETQSK